MSVPTKPSVVRDIFKPRSAQPLPTAISSGLSSKSTEKNETSSVSTSGVGTIDESVQTREACHVSQRREPKSPEHLEVPNTPTQRSSQLNIPEPPLQQPHYVQASSGVSALESSAPVHKRTPSIALCSVCRKQTILAHPGDKSPQWYVR